MAFGGKPFWRQPGNRRDSNKCRCSAPAIGVDKLSIRFSDKIGQFVDRRLAGSRARSDIAEADTNFSRRFYKLVVRRDESQTMYCVG
jgi:hypothetical protein